MRTGETRNSRKVTIIGVADAEAAWESVPAKPFGAMVVAGGTAKPDKLVYTKLATRLIETGCEWATLHGGKHTRKLHEFFDRAIVDYQLKHGGDTDMGTSGEDGASLEEAMREAVHYGFPNYGEPFDGLLVLVVAAPDTKLEEQCEALAKSVEAE
jgi:hypothetical protein